MSIQNEKEFKCTSVCSIWSWFKKKNRKHTWQRNSSLFTYLASFTFINNYWCQGILKNVIPHLYSDVVQFILSPEYSATSLLFYCPVCVGQASVPEVFLRGRDPLTFILEKSSNFTPNKGVAFLWFQVGKNIYYGKLTKLQWLYLLLEVNCDSDHNVFYRFWMFTCA